MTDLGVQISILLPALVAGLLVLSTHVPLGKEVLKRGVIFLDLAIAQIAAFGLILASYLGFDHGHSHQWLSQLLAITAAIVGASFLYLFRRSAAKVQEALIGVSFMLAATGSILLLAKDPQAGERLRDVLVGQILWVEYGDLLVTAIIYFLALIICFRYRSRLQGYLFYPLFAITITFSTQLVGVYLVFATLIVPALASRHRARPILFAYIIGALGYVLGLLLSSIFDLPSGPMIAWCLAGVGLLFYLFSACVPRPKRQL